MFASRVARLTLLRDELPLTSDSALELGSDFLARLFFQWVSAPECEHRKKQN